MNRLRARRDILGALPMWAACRCSILGQLYEAMSLWDDSSYRLGYIGRGHGGQSRAFTVVLSGEGVHDYGGPYRAVFESLVEELQRENVLPYLVARDDALRGRVVELNNFCESNELSRVRFLGILFGIAMRGGLELGLELSTSMVAALCGESVGLSELKLVSPVVANRLEVLAHEGSSALLPSDPELLCGPGATSLKWRVTCVDGRIMPVLRSDDVHLVPLSPPPSMDVDDVDVEAWANAAIHVAASSTGPAFDAFVNGLRRVVPLQMLELFSTVEMRGLL